MNQEDLRLLQAQFEPTRIERQEEYNRYKRLRDQFVQCFPVASMGRLTLASYCIGSGADSTFCYWVERKTRLLGSILGATAKKFGVYYEKKSGSYVHIKKYSSPEEALQGTRALIVDLLDAARRDDLVAMESNALTTMFKGKILSLYFPDSVAPVFSEEHLDHFMTQIEEPSSGLSWLAKNRRLMSLKNDDAVMKAWSVYEFMHFLYDAFKRSADSISPSDVAPELRGYLDLSKDFPDPESLTIGKLAGDISKPEESSRRLAGSGYGIPLALRVQQEENSRRGLQGELIAIRFEEDRLNKAGRHDLAAKIEHVAKTNSSAGYDLRSFNNDGTDRLIEVKATINAPSAETAFYLTRNEYETGRQKIGAGGSYYLYRVFGVKSANPKMLCVGLKELIDKARFEPLVYQVTVGIESPSAKD